MAVAEMMCTLLEVTGIFFFIPPTDVDGALLWIRPGGIGAPITQLGGAGASHQRRTGLSQAAVAGSCPRILLLRHRPYGFSQLLTATTSVLPSVGPRQLPVDHADPRWGQRKDLGPHWELGWHSLRRLSCPSVWPKGR